MTLAARLAEFEEEGVTRFPGLLSPQTCGAIRSYIDATLSGGYLIEANRGSRSDHFRIVHPMRGDLPVELAASDILAEIAGSFLRAESLRLRQQMFMKTLPSGEPPPTRADGWHVDTTFTEAERRATPRLTYVQFFCYASEVRKGGAATMVVPGSQHATYSVATIDGQDEERGFYRNPAEAAGIDLAAGMELEAAEGDVVVFDPMLLHSGSRNVGEVSRYVYHCSYYDASATRIPALGRVFYDIFEPEFISAVPERMRPLLRRPDGFVA